MLRKELAETRLADPRVEEARAVMSYVAEAGIRQSVVRRRVPLRVAASVAAVIALAAGLWALVAPAAQDSGYSAYIACNQTDDSEVALALMHAQLGDISEAAGSVSEGIIADLSVISEVFNEN